MTTRPLRKRQSKRLTESEDTEVEVELTDEDGERKQCDFEDVDCLANGGKKVGNFFYCIQKLSDRGANFVLFWVISNDPNVSAGVYLAAYGVDPRGSGHFTYTHAPAGIRALAAPSGAAAAASGGDAFPARYPSPPLSSPPRSLPPLKCTNRGDVLAWLASFCGAELTALPESEVRLPTHQMGSAELRTLLNRLQHAEHHRHHATATSLQPSIGNHMGANYFEYLDFLDYPMRTGSGVSGPSGVVGLCCSGGTAGADAVLVGRGPYGSQQFSLGRLNSSGVMVESVLGSPLSSPTTRIHKGAKVKPTASGTLVYLGDLPNDEREASEPSSMPRFRCGTCGRDDHRQDECPLGCISPPSLIHDPEGDDAHLVDHLILVHDGSTVTAVPQSDNDSPIQETAFADHYYVEMHMLSPQHKLAARAPSAGSPCRPGKPATVDWIHTLPPAGVEHTFRAWYATLTGIIADEPSAVASPVASPSSGVGMIHCGHSFSCSSGCPEGTHPGVTLGLSHKRWVPTGEALSVLHQLVHLDVDLALLERTQISRAVAALRHHHIPAISRAAEDVAERWRSSAEEALGHVDGGHQ